MFYISISLHLKLTHFDVCILIYQNCLKFIQLYIVIFDYYVGYAALLLPPFSVPALKPSSHNVDPDKDRSGWDPWKPSSKSNNSSSPKPGEMILGQIQKELRDSDLKLEPICFHPSPFFVFLSSQASVLSNRNQTQ